MAYFLIPFFKRSDQSHLDQCATSSDVSIFYSHDDFSRGYTIFQIPSCLYVFLNVSTIPSAAQLFRELRPAPPSNNQASQYLLLPDFRILRFPSNFHFLFLRVFSGTWTSGTVLCLCRACLRAIGKPLCALPSQRKRRDEFSPRISLSPSRCHRLGEKNVKGHARQRRVRGKNSCGRINGCRERRWRFCCHRNVQERPEDRNSALHGAAWHGARDNHRQDEREEKGERVGQPLTSDSSQKPGPSAAPHALCLSARGCTTFSRIRSLENLPPSIFALAIPLLSLNATRAEFRVHFSASPEVQRRVKPSKVGLEDIFCRAIINDNKIDTITHIVEKSPSKSYKILKKEDEEEGRKSISKIQMWKRDQSRENTGKKRGKKMQTM